MRVGGSADPGVIVGTDWEELAAIIGIAPRLVLSTFDETADAIPEAFEAAQKSFVAEHGASPVIAMMRKTIREQVRRSKEQRVAR